MLNCAGSFFEGRRSISTSALPYMDAPNLARLSALDGLQDNLHPYIRTFAAARAAVPDGIGWLAPNRFFALEVRRKYWV
jgi:hypothetical protein